MLTTDLLTDLCCPTCRNQPLTVKVQRQDGDQIVEAELRCEAGGETYPVRAGVPDLLPRSVLSDAQWKTWQDHLEGFQARREERLRNPQQAAARWGQVSKPQSRFAQFTHIREGKVLDIGCGSGKFRQQLRPGVQYYGLDPIVLPEVDGFPFVRALSEYIPFRDGTFSHVVVLAAMDHFQDLDAFFHEVVRVLRPGGKLHLAQSVHEVRGPVSAVRMAAHWLKDKLEDRATKRKHSAAPKHLAEFTTSSLCERLNRHFVIDESDRYNARWYSPTKLFVTLSPRRTS
jgi:SAM-dependent methyltransferase